MAGRCLLLAIAWLQLLAAPGGVKVSGTIVPEPSRAGVTTYVVLMRGTTTLKTRVAPDKTFAFADVPPGTYDAYVDDVGMDRDTILGTGMPAITLVVGTDGAIGVRLEAARRIAVKGSTLIEGDPLIPAFTVSFSNTQAGARPVTERVGYGGSIYSQLFPGAYRVTVAGLPNGYLLRSMTAGAIDLRTQLLTVIADGASPIAVGLAIDPSARSPFVKVSGRLAGGDASTYGQTQIILSGRVLSVPIFAVVAADGTFSIPRVIPGTYRIRYTGRPMSGDPAISLGVGDADLTNVELPLPIWREISGRVVMPRGMAPPKGILFTATFPNGAALSADGSAVDVERRLGPGQIVVTPLADFMTGAAVQADGRFIVRIPTGERRFTLHDSSVPTGTLLKSATYGNTDILKEPMRILDSGTEELVLTFVSR